NLTASIGDNATQVALSDGCFDLSDNFIVVLREDVDGGAVKSESGGPQDLYVCYNDPNAPTVFAFDSLGTSGPNYAYVVTDTAGTILGLPPGDMVDFAGAGPGECWVWGLSYTGTVTASVGDNALQVALASGCFDLSDNFIRVIRDDVDGGAVKSESAGPQDLYVCYNDPNAPTVFAFDSLGNVGPNYAYVVTDTAGTILGLPPGDMVDFAGAGPGECWVWGLSYTGTVTASVGDNALQVALSSGCFDLSDNFIRVIRDDVDGGMVQEANGMDTVLVCYAGGTPTTFSFDSTNTLGANFTYVVTNPNGVILGVPPGDMVDFSGAGPGECWVWGLSYTGTLTAQVGDTATQIALSSGCYDLSDNFVVALRDSTGTPCGTMLTGGGSTTLSLFPNPTQQDLILRLPVVSDTDRSAVIEIVSLEGKVLYRESMTRNPDVVEDKRIDVSLFAQGLYIVRVISPTQVLQQKFSKR
ncbi:MAG: T9SS type A sorting domain-containing protein, partial [Bacteroidota bacterium]